MVFSSDPSPAPFPSVSPDSGMGMAEQKPSDLAAHGDTGELLKCRFLIPSQVLIQHI